MQKHITYKLIFSMLLAFVMSNADAQFNNSWIDYNKTYYKIKVGQTGLYRIPYTILQSSGISSADASSFQMWRNGQEVPLFISTPIGVLGTADYIEFFGEIND